MDAQKGSQTKLTRTQSSLRSSPTIRSSIHSLTSVAEEEVIKAQQQQQQKLEDDLEEQKKIKPNRCGSTPRRTGSTRFTAVFTMVSLIFFTFFSLSFFFFFYLRREEVSTSENLLLALIFIAVTLFFASKNKNLINQNMIVFKQLWEVNTKRFNLCTSRTKSKQVQWFIGDPNVNNNNKDKKLEKRIIREGVEFYSNGDFYEGEFHKGKCNGSGVYNFFVNGRYEGDWVDGRYDGYGIESWARGSRYRGQYRQGLRHGYGVYRFYTGDSYAGEWFNGQSHGVGVQTCGDGSCYVGEFKCAVKHGLGVYHFR
jgi:NADH:ubiquinone oxidoreductase subunit 3 (subunit A)